MIISINIPDNTTGIYVTLTDNDGAPIAGYHPLRFVDILDFEEGMEIQYPFSTLEIVGDNIYTEVTPD